MAGPHVRFRAMKLRHQIAAECGGIASRAGGLVAGTLAIALTVSASLAAQTVPDTGTFVLLHRRDTVATERFTRTATSLKGSLSIRNARKTSESYSAVIAPDATLPLIEVTVREGVDSGATRAKVVQRARVIFKEDSVAVDEVGDGLSTHVFETEEGAIPYLNLSFALLEQAVRRSHDETGGSQVPLFNLGGGQTLKARITPVGRDSLTLDIGDVRYRLRVDREGRILGGRIPVQEVVVDRR